MITGQNELLAIIICLVLFIIVLVVVMSNRQDRFHDNYDDDDYYDDDYYENPRRHRSRHGRRWSRRHTPGRYGRRSDIEEDRAIGQVIGFILALGILIGALAYISTVDVSDMDDDREEIIDKDFFPQGDVYDPTTVEEEGVNSDRLNVPPGGVDRMNVPSGYNYWNDVPDNTPALLPDASNALYVQLKSSNNLDAAVAEHKKLSAKYPGRVFIGEESATHTGMPYKLLVGPFPTSLEADDFFDKSVWVRNILQENIRIIAQ